MCGIAGVIYADAERPVDPAVLKAMGDAIAHRGPDGEGYWTYDSGLGMVHRRLSIIDLSRRATAAGQRRRIASRSCSTARFTTIQSCAPTWKLAAIASRPTPIPRSSSTFTRTMATELVDTAARHVRLRPLGPQAAASAAGTRPLSASSRSTFIAMTRNWSLAPNSKRSWPTPTSPRRWTWPPWRVISPTASSRVSHTIFRKAEKLPCGHVLIVSHAALRQAFPLLLAAARRAGRASHRPGMAGSHPRPS